MKYIFLLVITIAAFTVTSCNNNNNAGNKTNRETDMLADTMLPKNPATTIDSSAKQPNRDSLAN